MCFNMYHVALAVFSLCLHNTLEVTSQAMGGLQESLSFPQPDQTSLNEHSHGPKQRCVLQCPNGYLPGTCLCQDDIFPFLFTATPCRFTNCRQGEVCRMREGKAICKVVYIDTPSIDVCNLHVEPGSCTVYIQRYFFDKSDGHCKTFTYSGCGGNGNSFATKAECENTCIAYVPHSATHALGSSEVTISGGSGGQTSSGTNEAATPSSHQIQICQIPFSSGPCFAHFPSYFFNSHSGQCEPFVYGGCGGNENRFQTREECERACRGATRQSHGPGSGFGSALLSLPQPHAQNGQLPSDDIECNLPKAVGMCRAYIPSFFYNTRTGECENFVYGGCHGNANRFESSAQCEQKCKSGGSAATAPNPNLHADCQQPKTTGRCRANIERWYFDQDSMSCKVFYYGGCGGSMNNFMTKTACERRCVPKPELAASSASQAVVSSGGMQSSPSSGSRPAFCSLPKVTGPCRASMRSFYFNPATSTCEMFIYGGCSGNDNRFQTAAECQSTCQASSSPQHQPGVDGTHVEQPVQGSISIQPLHDLHNVCQQPRLAGPCHANMPRFYYDNRTGQCQHFIYKGCGGNGNNFRSYSACRNRCMHGNGGRRFQ
ncbi:hypothetical protein V1264_018685 [Littorina saxatilis]|uniref:BPTI/Kunitz inhibitor domain-containing protein n=2 Tax=Littorina saxatilis TaxID=31220 RepID=A0AAN9GDQ6_9CAEN